MARGTISLSRMVRRTGVSEEVCKGVLAAVRALVPPNFKVEVTYYEGEGQYDTAAIAFPVKSGPPSIILYWSWSSVAVIEVRDTLLVIRESVANDRRRVEQQLGPAYRMISLKDLTAELHPHLSKK